jgi:diaminopimelate epimerase
VKLPFTKMHGTGNDFVLIDCFLKDHLKGLNLEELSKKLCDRRFGIGADQMLLLIKSVRADFRMRIFNADGSEVEMCGNGIRCLARYIWKKKLSSEKVLNIETLAGIIKPEKAEKNLVRVNMGIPRLGPAEIPVDLSKMKRTEAVAAKTSGRVLDFPLKVEDFVFKITCVSMGNPHAVIFVDDVEDFPIRRYGPIIEDNPLFPERTNVEFVQVISKKEIRMRVWERGTGETLACGTGACAGAVASSVKSLTGREVKVVLLGGTLLINWTENGTLYMTGPAEEVFTGEINI